nr:class I SAM-dependent methyltransferase [bacterium]
MPIEPANLNKVQASFQVQAASFETPSMNFSKKAYLDYTVSAIAPAASDCVLEVAAGTCACARAFAPLVQTVTCLDATPAMLEAGKTSAQAAGLHNMVFVKGYAEDLPFLDNSFDIVISRLAFHHFADVGRPFEEMVRVLKPGGKLAVIDMEAAEPSLRNVEDQIEALRDASHVRNLSRDEMLALFTKHALVIKQCQCTDIPVSLNAWLQLTQTPEPIQKDIIARMEADIGGHEKTGFSPYSAPDGIFFNQRWLLTMGVKPA